MDADYATLTDNVEDTTPIAGVGRSRFPPRVEQPS